MLSRKHITRSVCLGAMLLMSEAGATAPTDESESDPLPRQTWSFANGATLIFELEKGIYFVPIKGGQKIHLFAGKVRQWPGKEDKLHANGRVTYLPQSEGTKIVFAEVDGKIVLVTDTGAIKTLPMLYHKVLDKKKYIHWYRLAIPVTNDGASVQYLVLSLGYFHPDELDGFRKQSSDNADFLNTGETFLIREDGEFFRVDYKFHYGSFGNGFLKPVDQLFGFQGEHGNRTIDLRQFKKEASFEVRYVQPTDDHSGSMQDPIRYVLSFSTDLSNQVRTSELQYQPLDADTRDMFRRAFLKEELGNAVLLGPSGSGKTETVRRLVAEVVGGRIPELPRSVTFLSIDAAGLGSGTRFTGGIESKVGAMIKASQMMPIVWVVDEMHALQGQGTHSQNSNDLFQWLKPYLASGEIMMIGMSTHDEFYRAFSYDSAFIERFQVVEQRAPIGPDAIAVYRSWITKNRRPDTSEEVLQRVLALSEEYNAVGAQPRKGINLLIEAFADLEIRGESERALTVSDVERSAVRVFQLDRGSFDPSAIREKLRLLPQKLDAQVVGQRDAKTALLQQATSSLMGTQDPDKPRVSLLLSGPKGVGKTEIAYAYAEAMGLPLERIVMSQFSIHDQPTDLLRVIKRALEKNAFTVFLLDELDKAPRSMHEALLPVFDKGRFTLTAHSHLGVLVKAAEVSAKNASFILAANAALNFSTSQSTDGFADLENKDRASATSEALRKALAKDGMSEFLLDRIQNCVFMDFLSQREFRDVLGLHYRRIIDEQVKRHGVVIAAGDGDIFLDSAASALFQPRMSNRAALRLLEQSVRLAIAQGFLARGDSKPEMLSPVFDPANKTVRFEDCSQALESARVVREPKTQ